MWNWKWKKWDLIKRNKLYYITFKNIYVFVYTYKELNCVYNNSLCNRQRKYLLFHVTHGALSKRKLLDFRKHLYSRVFLRVEQISWLKFFLSSIGYMRRRLLLFPWKMLLACGTILKTKCGNMGYIFVEMRPAPTSLFSKGSGTGRYLP